MDNTTLPENYFQTRLIGYFSNNPESKIEIFSDYCEIKMPWGDDSVALKILKDHDDLFNCLNSVRLPSRLSAIWHKDSNDVEFIYASIKTDDDILSRKFNICFENKTIMCEFGKSTERLLLIARASHPESPPTETNYRNLGTIETSLRREESKRKQGNPIESTIASFYLRNIEMNEEELLRLCNHVNFYMRYYDRQTPRVIIHGSPITQPNIESALQYPLGSFPLIIQARNIDPYLLSLWESASDTSDSFRKFLYNYQIVEYAAFYYLKDELSKNVKRILSAPDIFSNIDERAKMIMDVLVDDKSGDEAKFNMVVQNYVEPSTIWTEIESKRNFFSSSTDFDGGCSIPALIRDNWTVDDFKSAMIPKLPDTLRKIRNSLVHSRESRQSKSILPNSNNQHLLRPWSAIMTTIAGQIIVYDLSL